MLLAGVWVAYHEGRGLTEILTTCWSGPGKHFRFTGSATVGLAVESLQTRRGHPVKEGRRVKEKFDRIIVQPFIKLLCQGLSPERLALSVAVGIAVGVFPIFGTTTMLCAPVAILFRLNIPAVQLVNYLVFPLQILLLKRS
jgi:hypothetical protein